MDIELTGSDLTEMKLFSFTLADSTVVKTEKLKIRWQSKLLRGRRGGTFTRGYLFDIMGDIKGRLLECVGT